MAGRVCTGRHGKEGRLGAVQAVCTGAGTRGKVCRHVTQQRVVAAAGKIKRRQCGVQSPFPLHLPSGPTHSIRGKRKSSNEMGKVCSKSRCMQEKRRKVHRHMLQQWQAQGEEREVGSTWGKVCSGGMYIRQGKMAG